MIKLFTCVSKNCDYIGLNQIYTEWEKKGYVQREHIEMLPDKRFIAWVGRVGGLALEPSDVRNINQEYEWVLACQYNSAFKDMPKVLPWNFYVREWDSFQRAQAELSDSIPRKIKSIFSGTIRNRGLGAARAQWINSTEVFSYVPAGRYTRVNRSHCKNTFDYYRELGNSKFGLCPVGDCPICQRESETPGMGCVAMYTPGVEWKYAVSPVEGRDFITVKDVDDMNAKMTAMSEADILEMSHNARKWFDSACTPDSLWKSVMRTVEEKNIKVD
jgi:hypothetical protein